MNTLPIPTVDVSGEPARQVIISPGTPDEYQGHPTTLLMPDHETMFCVYPLGHGGPGVVLRRSSDAGLTWSAPLPVPDNWATANNCPAIFRFVGPDSIERLFVYEGNGDMRQAMSLDQGQSWTPFEPNGLKTVMPFTSIIPIEGRRLLGVWSRHSTLQSISFDGGQTWGSEQMICKENEVFEGCIPCEPALIRSQDGQQIACIMRENSRRYQALIQFSDDEGTTWSKPVETASPLTGDRHQPRYTHDGSLVLCFRDMAADSPTKGHFVAWVGTYEDLVAGRAGQYRIKLLHSHAERTHDCGYPGLELLPDDTLIATTYIKYQPGPEKHSVVSVRFALDEMDQRV
jgi:hypothetical protein